jgi:glutaredoxin-like YruB-family protein
MKTIKTESYNQLLAAAGEKNREWLLLYRGGSEISECALRSLIDTEATEDTGHVYIADVNETKDIHPMLGVDSVPVLVELENGSPRRVFKGCNGTGFYSSVFSGGSSVTPARDRDKKSVTVYSTPSCSWCTTLKNYLKERGVQFREIDVSSDHKAAELMVKKSGQQGVPQTDINGKIIIGFDKKRIDLMLGL